MDTSTAAYYPGTPHVAPRFPNGSFKATYNARGDFWTMEDGSRWGVISACKHSFEPAMLVRFWEESRVKMGATLYPVTVGADRISFGKRWEGTVAEAWRSGLTFATELPVSKKPEAVHPFGV